MSEALFSAGVAGALRFRDARVKLRESCDLLWSETARARELSRALGELDGVRQRLAALQDLPREHGESMAEIARLEQELPALDQALDAARAEASEVERLRRAREALVAWESAQEALSVLPSELDQVPEGARASLENVRSRVEGCWRTLASAREVLQAAEDAASRARPRLAVEGREAEVKAALQAVGRRASQRETFPARAAAAQARAEEAARAQEALGLDWTAEALLSRELGAGARAPLLDLKAAADEASLWLRAAEAEARRVESERDRLAAEREPLEQELELAPCGAGGRVAGPAAGRGGGEGGAGGGVPGQAEETDVQRRLHELEGAQPEPRSGFPGWLLAVALALCGGLGAALARWARLGGRRGHRGAGGRAAGRVPAAVGRAPGRGAGRVRRGGGAPPHGAGSAGGSRPGGGLRARRAGAAPLQRLRTAGPDAGVVRHRGPLECSAIATEGIQRSGGASAVGDAAAGAGVRARALAGGRGGGSGRGGGGQGVAEGD